MASGTSLANNDHLVKSDDPSHPANLIPSLCAKFWTLGWVTGTGGGCSIRDGDLVYIAPSGVQKELMRSADIYAMSLTQQVPDSPRTYMRSPPNFKPSQCTPLFLAAFTRRGAGCCIHTHSQWAVLVTLLLEQEQAEATAVSLIAGTATGGKTGGHFQSGGRKVFEINNIEQIKAFPRGGGGKGGEGGNLGYHDTLRIPVIENTAQEEDLTEFMEEAMDEFPDACAVLVRRHGVYVWGDNVHKAKSMCESLDYLFQLAVEMRKLGIPWISQVERVKTRKERELEA